MNNEMEHPEQVGAVGYLGSRDSSLQKLPYNFNVFFGLRQDLNRCSCVRSPGPSLSTALPPSSSFWCNSQLLSLPKQYHFVCWRKTEKIRLYPPRTGHWSKICGWCKKQRIIFEDNILEGADCSNNKSQNHKSSPWNAGMGTQAHNEGSIASKFAPF